MDLKDIIGTALTAVTTLVAVLTYMDNRRSRRSEVTVGPSGEARPMPKAAGGPAVRSLGILIFGVLIIATAGYWVWFAFFS